MLPCVCVCLSSGHLLIFLCKSFLFLSLLLREVDNLRNNVLCFRIAVKSETRGGISRFRQVLPQILASVACNFVLLDLNSCLGYPTIIIAQLTKSGEIPLTEQQASWLGEYYHGQPYVFLSLERISQTSCVICIRYILTLWLMQVRKSSQ